MLCLPTNRSGSERKKIRLRATLSTFLVVNTGSANENRTGPIARTYFKYDNFSPLSIFPYPQPICLFVLPIPGSTFLCSHFWKEKKHLAAICFSALSTVIYFISNLCSGSISFCVWALSITQWRQHTETWKIKGGLTRLGYSNFYRFATVGYGWRKNRTYQSIFRTP